MQWAPRFWSKVRILGDDECWEWTAYIANTGYGSFGVTHRDNKNAHRVSFFLTHGRWPEPCCLHRCDNRKCVNPRHLFEGTKADNTADMVSKGRAKGTPRKLSDADRAAILAEVARGVSQRAVAAQFGVHQVTVSKLVTGKTKAGVPEPARGRKDAGVPVLR
jgi:hypothetical protein